MFSIFEKKYEETQVFILLHNAWISYDVLSILPIHSIEGPLSNQPSPPVSVY